MYQNVHFLLQPWNIKQNLIFNDAEYVELIFPEYQLLLHY